MADKECPPDDEILICGQLAAPPFRRRAQGHLSPCIEEPMHDGPHVYYLYIREGIDWKSSSGEFFEEVKRTTLQPVAHVDLRGKHSLRVGEAAAVYAVLKVQRRRIARLTAANDKP